MMDGQQKTCRRLAIERAIIYPLLGPLAMAFVMAAPLAVMSLFVLGPGGLLYYGMLGGWWLPGLYKLHGPPFLLAGVLLALLGLWRPTAPLFVTLVVTEAAYAVFFAAIYLLPGGITAIDPTYVPLWSDFRHGGASILWVIGAATLCWLLARRVEKAWPAGSGSDARPLSAGTRMLRIAAVAAGATAAQFVLAAGGLLPEEAWRDCTGQGRAEQLRGCSVIIARGGAEPAARRIQALMTRGRIHGDWGGDATAAIADYTDVISLDPSRAEAYAARGLLLAAARDDQSAIADLDAALRLDRDPAGRELYLVHRMRGLALLRRGETDRAIADFDEEIRRTPHYAEGWLHRGAAHLAKGDQAQAVADFTEAIRIEPYRLHGYLERGSVYLGQGRPEAALADFDEAIRRRPELAITAPAYVKRGAALERLGRHGEALAAYEKALALAPGNADARTGVARLRPGPRGPS